MISLIAAIGKNNELGKKNTLLWDLPKDMKYFRDTTRGHTVIMGQKTFESIGKALPNRKNIVITRNTLFKNKDVEISYSLEDTLKLYKNTKEEIFVIGGGEIYKQAIGSASKLYITHVEGIFPDADTFFPEIIPIVWNETSHIEHKKDAENKFDLIFSIYEIF
jgi:dihydrofolate reductase